MRLGNPLCALREAAMNCRRSLQPAVFPQLTVTVVGCVLVVCPAAFAAADEAILSRIAFGSCAKQDKPQPIWNAVVELNPQLFVFLGDNIYADTLDMDVMRAKYALL